MAGLIPTIHVFDSTRVPRRGCSRQARAWRFKHCGHWHNRSAPHFGQTPDREPLRSRGSWPSSAQVGDRDCM